MSYRVRRGPAPQTLRLSLLRAAAVACSFAIALQAMPSGRPAGETVRPKTEASVAPQTTDNRRWQLASLEPVVFYEPPAADREAGSAGGGLSGDEAEADTYVPSFEAY